MSTDGQEQPPRELTLEEKLAPIKHLDFDLAPLRCSLEPCQKRGPFRHRAKFLIRPLKHYENEETGSRILTACCTSCWNWLDSHKALACSDCGTFLGQRDDVFEIVEELK